MIITSSQIESFFVMWVSKLHLYCYLVNTLLHEEFKKFIQEQWEERNNKMLIRKHLVIEALPEYFDIITNSKHYSGKI